MHLRLVRVLLRYSLLPLCLSCGFSSHLQSQDPVQDGDKKQLESRAKELAAQAKDLEAKGQLNEAEEKFVAAEATISTHEGSEGLAKVRREKVKKVETLVAAAHASYDAGKPEDALKHLNEAQALDPNNLLLFYDLALVNIKLGHRTDAVAEVEECLQLLPPNDKNRPAIEEMKTALITGEKDVSPASELKTKIDAFNETVLIEERRSEGIETAESDKPDGKGDPPAIPCKQLKDLEPSLPKTPALSFNLAKCAEEAGDEDEALKYLTQYTSSAPNALDLDDVQVRVSYDQSLSQLSGSKGEQVRALYASAAQEIDRRKFGRAVAAYLKAEQLAPDYAPTAWKLGLLFEAEGNVLSAREQFQTYETNVTSEDAKSRAKSRIDGLEGERSQYDQAIAKAKSSLQPILLRSLNLDGKALSNKRQGEIGNMTYLYVQGQLQDIQKSLDSAASIFPLGPEVNEMLALIYTQGGSQAAALRCLDIVASQELPVAFYGTAYSAHDRKALKDVKVELQPDHVRLLSLASYDTKAKMFQLPSQPLGQDHLGNLVSGPDDKLPTPSDEWAWKTADLKGIETHNNMVMISSGKEEVYIEPLNLVSDTPFEGVPARKYANTYTRLFLRYMGYDNTKLGPEHMTGGEKFSLGMTFAAAGMGGVGAFTAAGSSLMAVHLMISIYAMNAGITTLRNNRLDQLQVVQGTAFKIIPSQSLDLAFREKFE